MSDQHHSIAETASAVLVTVFRRMCSASDAVCHNGTISVYSPLIVQ